MSERWRHWTPVEFHKQIYGLAVGALEDAFLTVTSIKQTQIHHNLDAFGKFISDVNFTYMGHPDFPFNHKNKRRSKDPKHISKKLETGTLGLYGMLERDPRLTTTTGTMSNYPMDQFATLAEYLDAISRFVQYT